MRPKTTLTFSRPAYAQGNKGPEEPPTQSVSSPGATWPQPRSAPEPGKTSRSLTAGAAFCFVFLFFFFLKKSLNHIGFLKNAAPGQGTTSGRPEQADPGEGPTFRRTPRERQAARGSRPRPLCLAERDTTPDFSGRGTAMTEAPLPFLEGRQAGTGPAGGSCPSLHPAEPTSAAKPPPRHWPWAAVAPGPRSPSGASAALLRPRLSTRPCRSRPEATALAPSLRLP